MTLKYYLIVAETESAIKTLNRVDNPTGGVDNASDPVALCNIRNIGGRKITLKIINIPSTMYSNALVNLRYYCS